MSKHIWLVLGLSLILVGCDSSNNDNDGDSSGPISETQQFDEFVLELFANTSDTTEPVDINDIEFTLAEDESAFDTLL